MRRKIAFAVWVIRQARGISQEQLGYCARRPRSWVSAVEVGNKLPTVASVELLAHALRVSPAVLLQIAETRR
jgi:transcriptional regulator with XRE-family HTH domain